MAAALATPHWDEIEKLAVQGVPTSTLSQRFGVTEKTIWDKACREDWQTPTRIKAKLRDLAEKQARVRATSPLLGGVSPSEFSDSLLLETWETRATSLRNLSYNVAVEAIKSAQGQIVIESASDLKHAVHVARQATGLLDTDAPQIQLSLFGSGDICGPSVMENECQGVVELQNEQELDGFWG